VIVKPVGRRPLNPDLADRAAREPKKVIDHTAWRYAPVTTRRAGSTPLAKKKVQRARPPLRCERRRSSLRPGARDALISAQRPASDSAIEMPGLIIGVAGF
jgi:hypothetical protein